MKKYLKYLPFVASFVGVFFAGRCTAPSSDKELIRKFELERKSFIENIKLKESKISDRDKMLLKVTKKMKEDHIRDSIFLKKNNEVYLKIIKQNETLNFRNATISKLDSARAKYITLYSH